MHLQRLKASAFRNLASVDLRPSPGFNLIHGDNGSGKTSLLEAIHCLSQARSFRTPRLSAAIAHGAPALTVFGELADEAGARSTIAVQRNRHDLELRLAGRPVRTVAELAQRLPVLVIDPDAHRLIEQGPAHRRRFLDWGVFHLEPGFLPAWQRYTRLLRQRNAALRTGSRAEVRVWDTELSEFGDRMDRARRAYLDALVARLPAYLAPFPAYRSLRIALQSGWPADTELKDALDHAYDRDRRTGHTGTGPHRADLRLSIDDRPARDVLSRGQQKLLAAILKLVQADVFRQRRDERPVLLIDDLPAELDAPRRARLMDAMAGLEAQWFVTAIEPDLLPLGAWSHVCRFHVAQGTVRPDAGNT